jgi:CBS domain-containing protein
MKLSDLAHSPLPAVSAGTSAQDAVEALRRFRSGALVVLDGDQLAGLLTEWDLVHRVVGEGRDPSKTPVRAVMNLSPATAAPDAGIEAAFEVLIARRARHIVLIDEFKRPVGLVPLRVLAGAHMRMAADTIQVLQDQANDALGG